MFVYNEKYVSKKEGCYYSCPWIEHGLVFFQYKLAMCCHCGHEGGGHTLVRNNFTGQKIDWDRIFKIKNMFRKFHKKGKINKSCIGCQFLKEDVWDGDNYINNLYISHWAQCNSKCIYCYSALHPDEFPKTEMYNVLPILKEMYEKGFLRAGGVISFGGGEPALLKEFDDIINFLVDNYFWGIIVHTSGIKYSPALARTVNVRRGEVVVSVDAGSPETYEKIKQVSCYEQVRETIRKYAMQTNFAGRYLVSAKYIIIPGINDTKEEVDKWLQANYDALVYTTVMDIEENWYIAHRNNIPQNIINLVRYAQKKSKQLNTRFIMYERLQSMMYEEEAKHKSLFAKIKG